MVRKIRKRLNLSVTHDTFVKLSMFAKRNHFKNECEVVCSMVSVMLDRLEIVGRRQFDISEDDSNFIDAMFADMGDTTRQANGDKGNIAVVHRNRTE